LPVASCVLDGEIVCLDLDGRPCFEDLQNLARAKERFVFYYAFDVMHLNGANLVSLPLFKRKQMLSTILKCGVEQVRVSETLECAASVLIETVKANKLEGIVAKHRESRYEPG